MKKYAIAMLALCSVTALKVSASAGGFYPDTLLVTEISDEGVHGYLLTGTTQTGIEYQWYTPETDWILFDLASVLMCDGGTVDTVLDDFVIECRYSGWVSDAEAAEWVK